VSPGTPKRGRPASAAILIVDDQPLLRRGLKALIESKPGLAVCGQVGTCQAALAAVRGSRPDLVIVDIALGEEDGLVLVKTIKTRYPRMRLLVLSMYNESTYAERSLRAGALGYLSKEQMDETLLLAIETVLDGRIYMSHALEAQLAARYLSGRTLKTDSPMTALSNRELQVFRLIGQGRTTRQIAESLKLSIKTIESHREHLKHKLAIASSAELAQRATQWVEVGCSR
jgi:DNA-binding NarL/FixJ family response regulator